MSGTLESISNKAVRVHVEDLKIGMYVSALDRPWLETPFLFQGFIIRDEDDIGELKRHCEHVYVDPEECTDGIDLHALARACSPPASRPAPPAPPSADDSGRRSIYRDIDELRRELAEARDQHDQAIILIREVMDNLSNGGKLDVNTAKKATQPIVESVMKNRSAMTWLVRMREAGDYIYTHSVSSAIWATVMARHIGMPKEDIEAAGLGAMLLDIGKTRISNELLARPGPLTPEEMAHVRRHVEFGVELLEQSGKVDPRVLLMVRTHHERHDGSGYPCGLSDLNIPVHGRIAGIVDFYDAVTSERPYARALSSYDCLRSLNRLAGKEFQAEMVEQFIQSIGFFPPGTLVELSDQSVAVVIAQNRRHSLKPEVLVVMDPEKNLLRDFALLDLQMPVRSAWTDQPLHIDKGLEPGSHGIDPSEFFLG
ncbi:MAG TPA: HD-GYP domain-containing protein [Woeseiaceae bacterium]|nr:HD-GYP domain-containing protein [Woeseiaceae bacterium]